MTNEEKNEYLLFLYERKDKTNKELYSLNAKRNELVYNYENNKKNSKNRLNIFTTSAILAAIPTVLIKDKVIGVSIGIGVLSIYNLTLGIKNVVDEKLDSNDLCKEVDEQLEGYKKELEAIEILMIYIKTNFITIEEIDFINENMIHLKNRYYRVLVNQINSKKYKKEFLKA